MLKRLLCAVFSLLILVGCNNNFRKFEPITKGIDFLAEIKYYNEHYECICDINSSGEMHAEFTYPAEIEGLKYNVSKNGISAEYEELEYINKNEIFENTAAYLIWDVLSNVKGQVKSEDNLFFVEGKTKEFDYRLELGSSGLPIKLTTKPDIIEVTFKNVKIK